MFPSPQQQQQQQQLGPLLDLTAIAAGKNNLKSIIRRSFLQRFGAVFSALFLFIDFFLKKSIIQCSLQRGSSQFVKLRRAILKTVPNYSFFGRQRNLPLLPDPGIYIFLEI